MVSGTTTAAPIPAASARETAVPMPGATPAGHAGVEAPAPEPHPVAADPVEATDPVGPNPPAADPAAEDPDNGPLSIKDAEPETREADEEPPAEAEEGPAGDPEESAGTAE
jgi:hypothetical protein